MVGDFQWYRDEIKLTYPFLSLYICLFFPRIESFIFIVFVCFILNKVSPYSPIRKLRECVLAPPEKGETLMMFFFHTRQQRKFKYECLSWIVSRKIQFQNMQKNKNRLLLKGCHVTRGVSHELTLAAIKPSWNHFTWLQGCSFICKNSLWLVIRCGHKLTASLKLVFIRLKPVKTVHDTWAFLKILFKKSRPLCTT